jgi:hypothetical protein
VERSSIRERSSPMGETRRKFDKELQGGRGAAGPGDR